MTDTERDQTLGQSRRARAIEKYRHRAPRYDKSMRRTAGWRLRGVEALELRAGQTVVDVACGTGANFAAILERIGPQGELIGVDLSAEMLSVAEIRAKHQLPGQYFVSRSIGIGALASGAIESRRPERTQHGYVNPIKDLLCHQLREKRSEGNPAVGDYNIETTNRVDPPADRPSVDREGAQADTRALHARISEAVAQIRGSLQERARRGLDHLGRSITRDRAIRTSAREDGIS
jgi:hypothetical protein